MKALVAALNRVAAAIEALIPALTQATREARVSITADVTKLVDEFDKAYAATERAFGKHQDTREARK